MNRSLGNPFNWPARRIANRAADSTPVRIREMINLAFTTLTELYSNGDSLCCNTMLPRRDGVDTIGESNRYSAISLIGLLQAMRHGYDPRVDLRKIMDRLIVEIQTDKNIGNLGLVCWAASMTDDLDRNEQPLKKYIRDRLPAIETVDTSMELQWLLTGTCKLHMKCADKSWLNDIISCTYEKLSKNFNDESDLFCSQRSCRIKGRWKKNICYFSDQVYGIYSLCTYYEAFGDPSPLKRSERIARKICSLQGDKGQWPWLYDSRKGTIISMYPVYSVHQDAMAPMALLKLSDLSDFDFTPHVLRGIWWVLGENELGIQMVDMHRGVIWRSIRKESKLNYKYALKIIKLVHIAGLDWLRDLANPFLSFEIDMECRPYHLGWLLNAFSGRY
jgi:hypothetical protein